jgi:osmotically inducible protein OsmC
MIMPVRTAEAVWQGDLINGEGKVTVLGEHVPYSFASRVEDGAGTNPEELLAAGHAGCVSMALSNELAKAGYTPNRVHTVAGVHLVKVEGGIAISQIDLTIEADVPGIDESTFQELANGVKSNCPVSKLFEGANITLAATLQSG